MRRIFSFAMFFMGVFCISAVLFAAESTEKKNSNNFVKELEEDLASISSSAQNQGSVPSSAAEASKPSSLKSEPQEEATTQAKTEPGTPAASAGPSGAEGSQSAESPAAGQESKRPAEEPAKKHPSVITDVEVRGNSIVSTNTILSKIKSQKGEPLMQETINEDLKRLYATGFFEDIKLEVEESPEGYRLIAVVLEKPVVKKIVLQGFAAFKEEKLRKELKIIEGQILDRKTVKEGAEAIRKLYRDKGFRFAEVNSDVDINYATKEATVVIRIEEGQKYKIKSIAFEGVKSFPVRRLTKLMKTKAKGLIHSGVFKASNFDKDLEQIKLFYQQEGFLDAKVSSDFDYDRKNQKILIKILVEEGDRYVTGDVKIQGNRLFPESEIWQELEMLPSKTFSQYYLSQDMEKIRHYYHHRGYMDARVIPDVRMNKETRKVDVTYSIEEGDLHFVEKVVIRGNTKTKDLVIRRELRIRPGERFDGEKIQKSKQRLENLGYFEEVTYDTEPANAPNRKDLVFRVKEKRTGELSFGGGVSSVDNFVGFVELSQKNFDLFNWPRFTGAGQSVSLNARVGTINQYYNFNFTEPYLLNKPITWSTDVYDTQRDDKNVDFNEQRMGIGTNFSHEFRDVLRVGGGYTIERVRLDKLSSDAPQTVRNFDGKTWLSRIKQFNTFDTRDNVFNPTKGMLISWSEELVGGFIGGDADFYALQASISKYWTFFKKHLLETKFRAGVSQEFGSSDEVPVFDRFYAGGLGTVRGYGYRRVSPIESGNAVGGQTLMVANVEYSVPVFHMEAFRFAAFSDAGVVNRDSYDFGFGKIAISIGPGVKIKTPLGPVAFYYGFPVAHRDEKNKHGRFEFSLSRGF